MLDHEPVENNDSAPESRDASAGGEASGTRPAAKRVRRRAASRPAGSPDGPNPAADAPQESAPSAPEPAAEAAPETPAPAKRAARKRTAKKTAAAPEAPVPTEVEAEPAPAAAPEPEPAPAAEEHAEAAKPVANAKRTRKTGVKPAKRVSRAAAAAEAEARPESTPEPAAETPAVVVPLPEDLDEDEAEQLVEALAQTEGAEQQDEKSATTPMVPAWSGNLFQAPVVPISPFRPAGARPEPQPQPQPQAPAAETTEEAEDGEENEQSSTAASRRRRRSRSRRGETGAPGANAPEQPAEHAAESDAEDAEPSGEKDKAAAQHPDALDLPEESSRRRRRRRRRQTAEDLASGNAETADDPPNTVVKVREPRQRRSSGGPDTVTTEDDVMGLRGSVRLVAKQQRRREGRATRSRRAPIVTEAEFLARRESVERIMVVRQSAGRTQIGVLEDGVLVEHYVNRESSVSYVGNVYLGKVQNVLPSMEAAFVDINKGRNAVLYAGEVNFDAAGLNGQPRRIESALKSGQSVLVQVTKDPIGHKGARLTSQISLPGRFLVYIPGGSMMGISRKLPDTERARLKQILKKVVPEDGGVIVRTAAEGASEQELSQDVARLVAQWEEIERKAKTASAPALLSGEPDLTVRVVRDIFNEDFSKLIVSGDSAYKTVHEYLTGVAPELAERIEHWTSETDVFSVYRIEEQLAKALDRKVWLPSGGSLVIDRTEAMVVIDVNTGKFTGQGSSSLEETVTRNNLEAAEEIVRQLRLRDLGGIVVIDFIDMVLESNRDLVLRRLLECLGRDRTKHQVAEVTSLGLVQMTRKRVGQGLLEAFSEPCEHCNGRGVIVHTEPVEHPGKRPEQQQSGKQGKGQNQPAAAHVEHEHAESPASPAEEARSQDGAGEQHAESAGEGRRSRRRRKAARAAGAAEQSDEQGVDEEQAEQVEAADAVEAEAQTEPEAQAADEDEAEQVETAAEPEEPEEPAEPLNLRAHAEDPDALENALADSGRPRRRARRAASRPAGAPSA
ncbi:ribonuclease E/G [Actinospica durhamensis]|uniref:Ribonuclease E n=1 Tax=Actinospica durhamensis TaxID=1508375 RepID=A0A941EGZ0_9ACTN|nr:Rne/Rng family ribonuclease [Actinospica durhamensis]MBR7832415.1 ribonuclease E/G [Actinospica durhamensis]